jgi:hypothetical protein
MGRRRRELLGLAEAAEYLYAIMDEFKAADEAAGKAMKEATTLLDVSVQRLLDAHRFNALAAQKKAPMASHTT